MDGVGGGLGVVSFDFASILGVEHGTAEGGKHDDQ